MTEYDAGFRNVTQQFPLSKEKNIHTLYQLYTHECKDCQKEATGPWSNTAGIFICLNKASVMKDVLYNGPEMESQIWFWRKSARLCQLSSHSRGFLSWLLIFKSIDSSLWISLGEGGRVFVYLFYFRPYFTRSSFPCWFFYLFWWSRFKTTKNLEKSIGKSIPAHGYLKSQEKICKPKVWRLLPNVCDFQKNHTLGYGFKNLQKINSLAYGLLFFVISISGETTKVIYISYALDRFFSSAVGILKGMFFNIPRSVI